MTFITTLFIYSEYFTPSSTIIRKLLNWRMRPCFQLWELWLGPFMSTSRILKPCVWTIFAVLSLVWEVSLWIQVVESQCKLQNFLLLNFMSFKRLFYWLSTARIPKIVTMLFGKLNENEQLLFKQNKQTNFTFSYSSVFESNFRNGDFDRFERFEISLECENYIFSVCPMYVSCITLNKLYQKVPI